jgi:hypothetical protein
MSAKLSMGLLCLDNSSIAALQAEMVEWQRAAVAQLGERAPRRHCSIVRRRSMTAPSVVTAARPAAADSKVRPVGTSRARVAIRGNHKHARR